MKPATRFVVVAFSLLLVTAWFAIEAQSLTVEQRSLAQLSNESTVIVYGTVISSRPQREGGNINTYTNIRIREVLKGAESGVITVKQLGGNIGDLADEIPGSPRLHKDEDVVLFLVHWQGHYWIHSIVLGKFSVVQEKGIRVAYNDLNNVGLIDPVTRREVTDPTKKTNAFPLDGFLSQIRSLTKRH